MNIKTLSQITPLGGTEPINVSAYFGISQYSNASSGKYVSRKVPYGQIKSQLSGEIDQLVMQGKYHAVAGGVPVDLTDLSSRVKTIESSDLTIRGKKTFSVAPSISEDISLDSLNSAVNVKCVKDMISENAGFISEGQHLDMDPLNGTAGYTAYDGNISNPKQMYWHIDHNQKDSSLWRDEYGAVAGPAICGYTGNLVCYGWLADNGNVKPGQAWVGLFGRVQCGDADTSLKWVALQVQPWIIGKYSQTMQYVSFNIPVKAGLRLKIMTGFGVNGNNTALTDDRPTLTFAQEGNMPNTFVGYILH